MNRIVETKSIDDTSASEDIVGTWFNTNQVAPEIARVELTQENDGLLIRAYGADDSATFDWGAARVFPHASPGQPGQVTGFEADLETDGIERHLAANLKLGVLVIQCYSQFPEAERGSYFTREFFHQRMESVGIFSDDRVEGNAADQAASPYVKAGDRLMAGEKPPTAMIDLGPYLGTWRNTYRHTRSASHLELLRDNDGYLVHGFGVDSSQDWGMVPAIAFADGVSSQHPAGFYADYDFGFLEMRLAANFNKGLLIVAAYNCFKDDSGRANYFTREFFYHEQISV